MAGPFDSFFPARSNNRLRRGRADPSAVEGSCAGRPGSGRRAVILYITLPSDDLALGQYLNDNSNNTNLLTSYTVDNQSRLSSQLTNATGPGVLGLANSLSASGHILTQDNEQLINLGRSPNGQSLRVSFPLSGAYDLPDLHTPIQNVPDLVSVAVGDMDKIPDAEGVNHDEVVVAYATGAGPTYSVRLAVLNYRNSGNDSSNPTWVTLAHSASGRIASTLPFPPSSLFSVAINDFDGDGRNEIAVATLGAGTSNTQTVYLSFFRYFHTNPGEAPNLVHVRDQTIPAILANTYYLRTISLMAGDFAGTAKGAQLVVVTEGNPAYARDSHIVRRSLQAFSVDHHLNATQKGTRIDDLYNIYKSGQTFTSGSVIGRVGLFKYDPASGFDLYRREFALINNEQQPISNDSAATLDINVYQVSGNLSSITPMFSQLKLPDAGVGAKFSATAGGLAVGANLNMPVWSLATAQLISGTLQNNVTTIAVGPSGMGIASTTSFTSTCCGGGTLATDNAIRPTVQAYDFRGRTIYLGAPVNFTVNDLINTDFVLQEPPKHAFWCESGQQGCESTPQQVVVVSRVPTIAASLTNMSGMTFSGKSTDTTDSSIGGSLAVTAKGSAGFQRGHSLCQVECRSEL